MPPHKLVLEDVLEESYKLLAIHCSVEEYKLAFLLNKQLNLRLARSRSDVDFQVEDQHVFFALYLFEDQENYSDYYLVSNCSKAEYTGIADEQSLFGERETAYRKTFLLPEYKGVDYFLKVTSEISAVSERLMLESIKEIQQVSMVYPIDHRQLKSKENLIFD